MEGLRKCRSLSNLEQPYQAWESCCALKLLYPHVSEIDQAIEKYRLAALPFVSLLEKAQQQVAENNYGSALSLYLQAQAIYAESENVSDGLKYLTQIRNQ